jgi:hypothetical protein
MHLEIWNSWILLLTVTNYIYAIHVIEYSLIQILKSSQSSILKNP